MNNEKATALTKRCRFFHCNDKILFVKTLDYDHWMVQPLSHDFPFNQGIFKCNDDQLFHPLICSPWITLIHLIDGEATLIAHQQKYHLKKDDVIVIGAEMDYRIVSNTHGSIHIIRFESSLINSDKDSLIYHRYIEPLLTMGQGIWILHDEALLYGMNHLASLTSTQSRYHLSVVSTMMNLWSVLYDAMMMTPLWVKASDESGRSGLIRWVHLHYASDASINVWAKAYHMSRSDFDRYFGLTYGTSALTYWNQYRVFQSLDLLKDTDLPIRLIAQQVGFESGSYYAVVFRQYMGVSPRDYREQFKQKTGMV